MKPDLKLFAIAIFLIAIPILMALPQSFLLSDVVLSQDAPSRQHAPGEEGRMPLFGKITAIRNSSFEISNPNGETVIVKLTPQTEFRKDREAAKRSDFKVGDVIAVRGQENPDHTWTAQAIGARSANGDGRGPNMQTDLARRSEPGTLIRGRFSLYGVWLRGAKGNRAVCEGGLLEG
jgi:hypothetical protein